MKHKTVEHMMVANVAPPVGAWIETSARRRRRARWRSPPPWGRGLKRILHLILMDDRGRPPRGGVD